MFIKTITISGFRSYRDQTFDQELSARHNVVVGKNGSGKSNFFAAIQFVLSEKYANLRAADRKDLFHVGAGRPALSIYVEIVFDNSDGRLVIPGRPEEAEVRIRRTIGLKQDEFRVNDRKFAADEVNQLLESAGFSASNPYYIVEQGKIVHLANMKEEARYELLKEVAGTRVYEARRTESEGLLEDCKARQAQIDESVKQIDDRVIELEGESAELKAFQTADRKRKSLEYCVHSSELGRAQNDLDALEAQWSSATRDSEDQQQKQDAAEAEVREAEIAVEACAKRSNELEVQRKRLEKERSGMASRRALADLKASEAKNVGSRDDLEKKSLLKEEVELKKSVEQTGTRLENKKKLLHRSVTDHEANDTKLQDNESKLSVLQAKRGRKGQFSNKADRDRWIKAEIQSSKELIASNEKKETELAAEVSKLEKDMKNLQADAAKRENLVQDKEQSFAKHDTTRKHAMKTRDQLNTERRRLWQEINEQEGILRRRMEDADRARTRVEKATRQDIRQGLKSLKEVLVELKDDRITNAVHGQVIELMEVDPEYMTAAEVTAGNTLFHIVVDNFDVSAKILQHMNTRKKPGRLAFFPLDTCKAKPKDLPTTADYSPLFDHVKHHGKFKSVFAELFGRTIVARNLDAGAAAVGKFDTDAITLEGDQFNRKGGITGGYVDRRNMKLLAYGDCKKADLQATTERGKLNKLIQAVNEIEQKITVEMQHLEQIASQDNAARLAVEDGAMEIRDVSDHADRLEKLKSQHKKTLETLRRHTTGTNATVKALENELKTELAVAMTKEEEAQLERLQAEVAKGRAEVSTAQTAAVQMTTDVEREQDTLRHLERRVGAIRDRLGQLTHPTDGVDAGALKGDVDALEKEIKAMDDQLLATEKAIDANVKGRKDAEDAVESKRRAALRTAQVRQKDKEGVDKVHNDRALLSQQKEDAQAKIRKLGLIPQDVEKYQSLTVVKLLQQLKVVNDDLKKYGHVNKKALDQYTGLVETRGDLHEKRESLHTERLSIDDMLSNLDRQRGEAIERTYKQVAYQFEQVFKELVTADGAEAKMVLVKAPRGSKDPFSAVRVQVGFGIGAVSELSQLSGGQKSLVALALIFAIQRSDPAPFYLFDEIDAALDAEYRSSVARLLQKQSESCQFITASFKQEMVDVADKVYGIFFKNKISKIHTVSQDEGKLILLQAAQEGVERSKRVRDGEEGLEGDLEDDLDDN